VGCAGGFPNGEAISEGGGHFARRLVHIRGAANLASGAAREPPAPRGQSLMTVGHVSAWTGSPSWRMVGGVVFFRTPGCGLRVRHPHPAHPELAGDGAPLSGIIVTVATAPRISVGLLASLGGLVVGLLIWLPSWLFKLLGAGDVKMFAAAGAWLGCGGHSKGRSSPPSPGASSRSYGCSGIEASGGRR